VAGWSSDARSAERQHLEAVTARLVRQFPELPERDVRAVVAAGAQRLEDARVRQFVPLLVERAARADFRRRQVSGRVSV
jgi:hypothetical protein